MQFPKITSVKAKAKYRLFITFSDSTEGEYDVSRLAGKGVFKTWDIDNNFFKVSINPESGAITWAGELDIDTINAYCNVKDIDLDQCLSSRQEYAA